MGNLQYHNPVLLTESIDYLRINPNGIYVDCTFGGGGHSSAILEKLGPNGRLLAFDQDQDAAINIPSDPRFTLIEANFKHIKKYLRLHGVNKVNGIIADLGVSSHQFDEPSRGFLFRNDAPLDMRMDQLAPLSAVTWLQTTDEQSIANVLKQYGEIKNAHKVANALFVAGLNQPITTTKTLCDVLRPFVPKNEKETKFFAKAFQAIRIVVNQELEALEQLLLQAPSLLIEGGRMVVISYHSLEDRLVKHFFRSGNFADMQKQDIYGNIERPFSPKPIKAIVPTATEINNNPRARSAKMRIGERL